MSTSFDILIASFNRSKDLKACLESVMRQKTQSYSNIHLLLLRSDIESNKVISEVKVSGIGVELVDAIPPPGKSRNLLVEASSGEFKLFLDDDVELTENYLEEASKILTGNEFDVFGGSDSSIEKSSFKQEVIASVLGSYFVMGPTAIRHSKGKTKFKATEIDLTLCNLWVRSSLFEENTFDEVIMRCEENILLDHFAQHGVKMGYFSELTVKHKRRENFIDQAAIQYKSGYFRGVSFFMEGVKFKPLFLLPIVTGLLIILMPLIDFKISFSLIVLHTLFTIAVGINIFYKTNNILSLPLTWMYTVIIHVFFSIGIVCGSTVGLKGRFVDRKY